MDKKGDEMRYFSMFSGIGGFEYGIEKAVSIWNRQNQKGKKGSGSDLRCVQRESGGRSKELNNIKDELGKWECVGFSEVDKYAIQIFQKHWKGVKNYGDATKISTKELPDFDFLVGGFPCQSFSMAGKRRGLQDTRGTLFYEIARICADKRPRHFLLENVKGLLSHESGETFTTILRVFTDLGYVCQFEVCNSCDFGVPQNRERVFIVGHLRGDSIKQIFPLRESATESEREDGEDLKYNAQASSASPMEFGFTDNVGALRARDYKDPKIVKIEKVGNIYKSGGQAGSVVSEDGLSPTFSTGKRGGIANMPIVASRSDAPFKKKETAPIVRCSDKGDVRVITKSHKEDKCILAPNNFNHHAGEGSKGRKRRLTNKVPAIQASRGGSSQESYVVTKQKKKK